MDLKRLQDKAKGLIDKRGGTDSLKEDAAELKEIANSKGSLGDKAKAAMAAIKDPGSDEAESPAAKAATAPERDRAKAKAEGEERGKRKHGAAGKRGEGGGRKPR